MSDASAREQEIDNSPHPLDHVIWEALTTRHKALSEGDELARRYPVRIGPLAATLDMTPASFQSLERLVAPGDRVALFTLDEVPPSAAATFDINAMGGLHQMIKMAEAAPTGATPIVPLDASDVADMLALVELTHPGPFNVGTHELGGFIGVRSDGQLVAMAGQRMRIDGFTEVSAVCVHPDYRGRGYAADLVLAVSQAISDRGETPFLHVFSENPSAIALYTKVGFSVRQTLRLTVLERPGEQ